MFELTCYRYNYSNGCFIPEEFFHVSTELVIMRLANIYSRKDPEDNATVPIDYEAKSNNFCFLCKADHVMLCRECKVSLPTETASKKRRGMVEKEIKAVMKDYELYEFDPKSPTDEWVFLVLVACPLTTPGIQYLVFQYIMWCGIFFTQKCGYSTNSLEMYTMMCHVKNVMH